MESQYEKITLVVGLCDDEQHIHDTVEEMLSDYSEDNNIVFNIVHYYGAEQLVSASDRLDFLLLDIEMPEMDGIEAASELRRMGVDYKIIMLTAKIERFKEAFEISAFRFVSKPINRKELYRAIDDVRQRLIGTNLITVYRNGIQYELIEKDVLFIEAGGSETLVYTSYYEYRSEKSLASWISVLDNRLFFQCHKSFIVNMGKIDKIEKNNVILINGDKVAVSRRLYKPLLQTFMEFDTKRR